MKLDYANCSFYEAINHLGASTIGTEGDWSPKFSLGWDQPCIGLPQL